VARAVRELRASARVGRVDGRLLRRLRRAWLNDSFAADAAYLGELASLVLSGPGPFLECGSGLSTLVAGIFAEARGARVMSLEQDADWHRQMLHWQERLALGNVEIRLAPITRQGDFAWYDLTGVNLPAAFSHVFCDGPALWKSEWADPMFANWRAGVVPLLRQRGIVLGEILLDDAENRRCAGVCRLWNQLGLTTELVATPTGSFVLARPQGERSYTPQP